MRRSLTVVALALALAAPTNVAFGFSKTAQKVAFAAGLLVVGGAVRALIRRDRDKTAERVAELRARWGAPTKVVTVGDGFDTIRVETYRQHARSAWATFRNDRLVHIRYEEASAGSGDGSDASSRRGPANPRGGSRAVQLGP